MTKCSYCKKVKIIKVWLWFFPKQFHPTNDSICPKCQQKVMDEVENLVVA